MAYEPDAIFEGVSYGVAGKSRMFQGDFWEEMQFVPLSQSEFEPDPLSEDPTGTRGTLTVRGWLVRKNGWQ